MTTDDYDKRRLIEWLPGREPISERDLRRVLQSLVWEEQVAVWATASGLR